MVTQIFDSRQYGQAFTEVYEGYFVAPEAGEYRFYVNSNGATELRLANDNGNLETLVSSSTGEEWYEIFANHAQGNSWVHLDEGEARELQVFHWAAEGAGKLVTAVEVEPEWNLRT